MVKTGLKWGKSRENVWGDNGLERGSPRSRSTLGFFWGTARWGWSVRSMGETGRRRSQRGDKRGNWGTETIPHRPYGKVRLQPSLASQSFRHMVSRPWGSMHIRHPSPPMAHPADFCAAFEPKWDVWPLWKLLDILQPGRLKQPPP